MVDLSSLTLASFEPHVGTTFLVNHPVHQEHLTLERAVALPSHDHPRKLRDPFSLFFAGSRTDQHFNQQVLPLKHDALGELEIFVVPIAKRDNGTLLYQAVFN